MSEEGEVQEAAFQYVHLPSCGLLLYDRLRAL